MAKYDRKAGKEVEKAMHKKKKSSSTSSRKVSKRIPDPKLSK